MMQQWADLPDQWKNWASNIVLIDLSSTVALRSCACRQESRPDARHGGASSAERIAKAAPDSEGATMAPSWRAGG